MKDLFDTEEKSAQAIADLVSLLDHPGWKLLEKMLDIDIESLKSQLEEGTGNEETKQDVDLLRYKLSFSREHRNKPMDMIKKLQSPESEELNPDPFPTADSLKADRNA